MQETLKCNPLTFSKKVFFRKFRPRVCDNKKARFFASRKCILIQERMATVPNLPSHEIKKLLIHASSNYPRLADKKKKRKIRPWPFDASPLPPKKKARAHAGTLKWDACIVEKERVNQRAFFKDQTHETALFVVCVADDAATSKVISPGLWWCTRTRCSFLMRQIFFFFLVKSCDLVYSWIPKKEKTINAALFSLTPLINFSCSLNNYFHFQRCLFIF